jgi:pimeloyl-ACP methyl ester carboxylesterase
MPVKPLADLPTVDSAGVALSTVAAVGALGNARDIAYVSHGHGPALAVVMAPVMPYWDEGAFFAPLTARLMALGYRVMIFDSLSLQPTPGDLPSFAKAWRQILQGLGPIQLLAGGALGGAVVQSLLASRWAAQIPATLLISAPTQADERLDERLGYMAQLAAAGELTTALRWLDHWVAADTGIPGPPPTPVVRGLAPERPDLHGAEHQPRPLGSKPPHHNAMASACERLEHGFGLLAKLDLRNAVNAYPGRLLSLYGEQSHLVRASNVSFPRTARHLAASIPGSGMRPHIEQPARVWACVQEHLHLPAHIAS